MRKPDLKPGLSVPQCRRIFQRYLLFLPLSVLLWSGCHSQRAAVQEHSSNPTLFKFLETDNLAHVLDLAIENDKLVFVDMVADWCLPCQLMDEEVFSDPKTARFFNEHFVNYKVDGEKRNGPDLVYLFGVKSYPTVLFLDTKGRVIERKTGVAFADELMSMARRALDRPNGPQ